MGKLVQNEVQLARAEVSQKLTQAGTGAAFIGAGAILIIPVLVMLLTAMALWFNQLGFSSVASYLLAAFAGGVISVALAMIGMSYLKLGNLIPKVTVQQVGRDVAAVKELVK